MQIVQKKLSDLISPDKNVRYHNQKQIQEFARSLEMFGQIRPVVVDENNIIRCGNGLVAAMRSLGYETADVYVIENLSENNKKKLMIADNRIYGLGVDNLDTLNEFFEELKGDLDIPGYDEEILNSIVADAEEITEKLSEFGTLDEDEIEEIKVGAEKRETEKPVLVAQSENHEAAATDNAEESEKMEGAEDAEKSRKFITCPKCGEKIWL